MENPTYNRLGKSFTCATLKGMHLSVYRDNYAILIGAISLLQNE
jgi:hypothetical protein